MEISLLDGQAFEVRKCLSFGILCGSGLVSSSALLGYWVDLSVWFVGVIVFVFAFAFVCFLFVSNTALQSLFFYTFFSFFFFYAIDMLRLFICEKLVCLEPCMSRTNFCFCPFNFSLRVSRWREGGS